jgi:subtilisin family serine protease
VELAANVWVNPYEIPGNGVDDDGNGYIDDMRGWDFVNNDNSVFDGRPGDNLTDSHGTHVAGTIGAIGGNGIGVAGVNWHVTMISAKFLGSSGGTNANAVRALDYVTNLKKRHPEMNIVATNNSWGGGNYSQAIHDAIIRAAKQNILFVVAAGNAGTNLDKRSKLFPAGSDTTYGTSTESGAGYDAVITVAAIDSKGALASFSNYGPQNVDLAAPGVTIASTAPNGTYKYMNGTSMATPHVTGTAAIYAAAYPWAAPWTIRSAILSSAVWTPSLNGKVGTNGRLNAYEALRR